MKGTPISLAIILKRLLYFTELLKHRCVFVLSHSVVSNPMDCMGPPGSTVHGDSPGKKTEVGCHTVLQ